MTVGRFLRTAMVLAILASALITTGCNTVKGTVHGAGKDIQELGEKMQGE